MPQGMGVQVRFGRVRKEAIVLRQLGSEIRATPEDAVERTDLRGEGKTGFLPEPVVRHGLRVTQPSGEEGKGQPRSLCQDSNQSLDFPPLKDLTITISVVEGPSKGLVYEMRDRCITVGRTGGGADFQFDEPEASEIQCIIATRQNGVCLYDAVSIHGTFQRPANSGS